MKAKINNIDELKAEIVRLSQVKSEQEVFLASQYSLLKKKVDTPARIFGAVTSSIPGVDLVKGLISSVGRNDGVSSGSGKKDWLTKTLQLGLPFLLNKTFLKNSGFLKKSLVMLASEGAAGQINQEKVSSVISKVADFIRPKKKKKKHNPIPPLEEEEDPNFGIPPDSETY